MTATEILRRMLDERGVEWGASDTYRLLVTSWNDVSGHSWAYMEHRDGSFSKLTAYHITPEQAIAATVGSDEVEAVLRKLIAQLGIAADFHFARKYVDCIVEEYAGKLATLGTGTCNADETDTWECVCDDLGGYGKTLTVHVMECTECGHVYEHVNGDYEFCPRCGRKRRDVEE